MNDLDMLNEMRGGVNEPSTDRLALGRARLVSAIRTNEAPDSTWIRSPFQMPTLRWSVTVAGGLTAVLVGIAIAAPSGTAPSTGGPVVAAEGEMVQVSAAQYLNAAADTVAARPTTPPRRDQWIYVNTQIQGKDTRSEQHETWYRFDGKQVATRDSSGALKISPGASAEGDDPSPAETANYLTTLPTDPEALLKKVQKPSERKSPSATLSRDELAFAHLASLLKAATVSSPKANAALLRALALIPGIRLDQNVTDAAGRKGTGITRTVGSVRHQVIFDDASAMYLGQRYITEPSTRSTTDMAASPNAARPEGDEAPLDHDEPGVIKAEELVAVEADALLLMKIVDRAGQRD